MLASCSPPRLAADRTPAASCRPGGGFKEPVMAFAPAHDQHVDTERRDALVSRLFEAAIGTFDLVSVYLGERLGLYASLARHGPSTAAELAERTRVHERYAREWLEQQAVPRPPHVVE